MNGQKPSYQQKAFGSAQGLTLVASPTGEESSLIIKQEAKLYQLILSPDTTESLPTLSSRNYYVHAIDGPLVVKNDDGQWESLQAGDGIKIQSVKELELAATPATAKAVVFDLP